MHSSANDLGDEVVGDHCPHWGGTDDFDKPPGTFAPSTSGLEAFSNLILSSADMQSKESGEAGIARAFSDVSPGVVAGLVQTIQDDNRFLLTSRGAAQSDVTCCKDYSGGRGEKQPSVLLPHRLFAQHTVACEGTKPLPWHKRKGCGRDCLRPALSPRFLRNSRVPVKEPETTSKCNDDVAQVHSGRVGQVTTVLPSGYLEILGNASLPQQESSDIRWNGRPLRTWLSSRDLFEGPGMHIVRVRQLRISGTSRDFIESPGLSALLFRFHWICKRYAHAKHGEFGKRLVPPPCDKLEIWCNGNMHLSSRIRLSAVNASLLLRKIRNSRQLISPEAFFQPMGIMISKKDWPQDRSRCPPQLLTSSMEAVEHCVPRFLPTKGRACPGKLLRHLVALLWIGWSSPVEAVRSDEANPGLSAVALSSIDRNDNQIELEAYGMHVSPISEPGNDMGTGTEETVPRVSNHVLVTLLLLPEFNTLCFLNDLVQLACTSRIALEPTGVPPWPYAAHGHTARHLARRLVRGKECRARPQRVLRG